ncbi:hypothetical protein Poly51_08290 [Rubripirellula tenax]|uniref:Ice-binding protein C-terminal domain-containing protein n=1 Tax=Rubripirellula tenax TaxID=2528015 RepID=A0A5C6FM14_9BACT|nr:PEP-CTERM sorting domain-containing protein [Rubripirellula tenax]TWU60552.1 hypothetical protein Poly51_08290 [Rubripirellula tenax]
MKKYLCSLVIALAITCVCPSSNAAVVSFNDYASYQAALGSSAEVVFDFDNFSSGAVLSTFGGITFSGIDNDFFQAVDVQVFETDAVGDTISGDFYVGREPRGIFDGFATSLQNDTVTLSFGSAQKAVGLFVIAPNNRGAVLTGGGTAAVAGAADPIGFLNSNQAFFVGLVDDSGLNSINSVTLTGNGGAYYFDNLTTSVAAVPEPGSFLFCGLAVAGTAILRRRRNARRA